MILNKHSCLFEEAHYTLGDIIALIHFYNEVLHQDSIVSTANIFCLTLQIKYYAAVKKH
jgi:hypothetical protein